MTKSTQGDNTVGNVAEPVRMSRVRTIFLRHEWLRGYSLLSPTLLMMICALALPIVSLVIYSFWSQDYVTIDKTLTLTNYTTFFDKWIYGQLLWRSIKMSATVTSGAICSITSSVEAVSSRFTQP